MRPSTTSRLFLTGELVASLFLAGLPFEEDLGIYWVP